MGLGAQERCMGCMKPLNWDGRCLHCNFEQSEYSLDLHYLPLGALLKNGDYMVGKVLGSGGFGITYIGFDRNLLSRVAIKEYYPARFVSRDVSDGDFSIRIYSGDTEKEYKKGLESFIEEARILARFSGMQGIVNIRSFFRENETAYIVMDCVEGISVKEYVQNRGKINPELVLEMMEQPIRALQKVHEEMLVHRDVSADNFIIDQNGKVTLIDFGAARYSNVIDDKTNTAICKQGFSALEQYSGSGKQGPWTDVYSICATMYYMMTGIVPKSSTERIVDDTIVPLQQMEEINLDQKKKQIIMSGMAVKNNERIQNMEKLYLALYGKELVEGIKFVKEEVQNPVSQKSSRKSTFSPTALLGELSQMTAERKKRARKKRIRKIITGVAAILLLALVLWKVTGNKGVERNVTKQTAESGHEENVVKFSDTPSQEKLPAHEPEPTTEVGEGEKKTQEVKKVKMPKVSGVKKATAIKKLGKSGLQYKIVYRYSDSVEKGKVIRANVTEGKAVKKEKLIILYISKGKKRVVVRTTSKPKVTPSPTTPLLSVPEEVQKTNKNTEDDSMAGDIDSILN